jgi:uracil-DNA glycosylase family 4
MPTSRPTPSPPPAADRLRQGYGGPPKLYAKVDRIALPRPAPSPALLPVYQAIVSCERCPRLRAHCRRIATLKKAAFRDQTYWGRPVPGFGDPRARVLLIGLAPAAHGANRTGRVFTGDGSGGSGDFLMRALHVNGLASQPTSRAADDGLQLTGAYIAAAARCAPPGNKPTPRELERCRPFLEAEWDALADLRVVVCLGRIAFDICWRVLADRDVAVRPRPAFAHGGHYPVRGGPHVLAAFHPSRQNTNTGRLTPLMMEAVLARARALAWP